MSALPQTPLGELTALPQTSAGFKGPTCKGREVREGRRGERKRGKKGRDGKGGKGVPYLKAEKVAIPLTHRQTDNKPQQQHNLLGEGTKNSYGLKS